MLEREDSILRRASSINQARVHNGYHYPRSFLTGVRSRANFAHFAHSYADCIDKSFTKYYAVAKRFSRVTPQQFTTFCNRIRAPIDSAPREIKFLFNRDFIADVFLVEEYAFDAEKLAHRLLPQLSEARIDLRFNAAVQRLTPGPHSSITVTYATSGNVLNVQADQVFNCTYSRLNEILAASHLPLIPLKHELTELALVEVPEPLTHLGITVVCGPFFSVMPFPPRHVHTLTHVRYTPHFSWQERDYPYVPSLHSTHEARASNFPRMVRDAQRYLPLMTKCRYVASLWEVKSTLPSSEVDDSRPILFVKDHGLKGLTCILGGKIDNVFDVVAELELLRRCAELA